jgi:aspartate carbamoyltransferase regulatory subunit
MAEDIRTMHEEDEDEVKYCERKRLLFFGLPWTFTKYTITPSMLTIDQGLLKTEENDCYMYKVQDVKLTTTLLERIFGLGTITCYTGDVTNAKSNKMGKKDILKVECPVEALDLDILGFIDHNITVNVIKDSKIVEKKELHMPKQVKNVIRCKNPRCITSIEQELDQIFLLTDESKEVYRCKYCEEKYTNPNRR